MINLDYIKKYPNSDYLNRCIIYALTFINLLNRERINKLDLIVKNYNAQMLAQISLLRTKIYFIMDNITTIHKNNYINELADNLYSTKTMTFDALSIVDLQEIINDITKKLIEIRDKVEVSEIPNDSPMPYHALSSIFEENKVGTMDSEFLKYKNTIPLYFNYYEGKNTLKKISSLLKDFSNMRNKIIQDETSMSFSFVSKMKLLVSSEVNKMQNMVVSSEGLTQINDSCIIANAIYEEFDFVDFKNYKEFDDKITIEIFLARKYSEVKKDVMKALENNLT